MDFRIVTEALRVGIEAELPEGTQCVVGVLPPVGGVSLVLAGGKVDRFMDGGCLLTQQITVNAKSADQRAAVDLLTYATGVVLGKLEVDGCQITGSSVKRPPAQVGMDTAGNFLFAAVFEIRAYFPEG